MKKVLIITYYWPPAGGPGVQRVLKFAKYLPEFGWQPVILTVLDGEYPAYDIELKEEIPKGIKIFKTSTIEPFVLYKLFFGMRTDTHLSTHVLDTMKNKSYKQKISQLIRANLFIPDARIWWYLFAVKKGIKLVKNEKIDLIMSSSPPQTTHLIAKKIAQKTGKKWIADFRDPWTDYFRIKDLPRIGLIKKLDKHYEHSVLRNADTVVTSGNSLGDLLNQKIKNNY
ncbi:group 1 glycosyl transferase, partial [Candidatus Cloacimonadota bacterium]